MILKLQMKMAKLFLGSISQKEYTLEVSSPGLERKLTKQDHFINSIGEKAKITTVNKEKFEGEIIGFDDEILTLKTDKENLDIKFDEILKAKTFIEW